MDKAAAAGGSKGNPIIEQTNSKNGKLQRLPRIVQKSKSNTGRSKQQQQPSLRPANGKRKGPLLINEVKIKKLTPDRIEGRSSTTTTGVPRPISSAMKKCEVVNSLQNVKVAPIPPEVWEHIAVCLDLLSLKSLRLCSKMLNAVANRTIYYRTYEGYFISFKYDREKKNCFFAKQLGISIKPSWMKRKESIDDLIELLENSPAFPCHRVRLFGGSIYSSDIKKFFQRRGQIVKTMKVELCRRHGKNHIIYGNFIMDSSGMLLDLLGLCPNLEFLELSMSEEILEHKDVPGPVKIPPLNLPALKHFKIHNFDLLGAQIIQAILTAAPNINRFNPFIRSMRGDYVNLLTTTNTFHCVKHLHFQPDTHTYDQYDKMTSANLQLESIAINLWNIAICKHIWPGVSMMMSRVLESSKDTLTKISLETPVGFLDQVNWPVLSNLSEVLIMLNQSLFNDPSRQRLSHRFLPDRLDWAVVFPRNRQLTLIFKTDPAHHVDTVPIFGNTASLKVLNIPCIMPFYQSLPKCVPPSSFENLPTYFSSLTHLRVQVQRDDFAKVFRIIWKNFKTLNSLRVEFMATAGLWLRSHLNSAITGFSESTCIQLRGGQPFMNLEKLRVHPSILNLKDLTEFQIVFDTDESWTDRGNQDHLLNDVAFWHAFQLMPALRVKILARSRNVEKVNQSLKSIASHVAVQVIPPN